ncbi:hypothetical protein [Clostridium diolis]|uniref:KAP NTPase domain-containing protein n=1 Tax=Clostridium diolis TaxID=223919 RepID=A0AAV3VZ02_9CLOT|nr:hypothetical protein [Clostridium diolis]GEA31247.1 hypothetical protein CDIOL_21700 [Clostridium diolis]
MAKLYESRVNNLIKPLTEKELGYVFGNKYIDKIIEDIDKKKYGSYLIGGVVGTGKSSLVDIASKLSKENIIVIHIKFYNEEECVNKFLQIVMESLINELEKIKLSLQYDGLEERLERCKNGLYYNIKEQYKEEESKKSSINQKNNEKVKLYSKIGAALNKIFVFSTGGEVEKSNDVNISNGKENNKNRTITMTKLEENMERKIISILEMIEEQQIIFVYDELDKMNVDILQKLFSKFKSLFVEKNFFNFFLVNDEMFIKYNKNDMIENALFTYFSGFYYLPLLNLRESLRYSMMMFGETDYLRGISNYYQCLGNYRLINSNYNSFYIQKIIVIKAVILKQIIDKINVPYLEEWYIDVLNRKIKRTIEEMVRVREFAVDKFVAYLENKNDSVIIWPGYEEIIGLVIDEVKLMVPDALREKDDKILFDGSILYEEYNKIEEVALSNRNEEFVKEESHKIQISDMYEGMKKEYKFHNKHIVYLNDKIIPVEVAENDPESYKESLINIMKANLEERAMQVIVLKRERGEESFSEDDYEYTGIVIIEKGKFQIAYYVDRGSYKSDRYDAINKLIDEANNIGVSVVKLKIEKRLNIKENIGLIVEQYNTLYF